MVGNENIAQNYSLFAITYMLKNEFISSLLLFKANFVYQRTEVIQLASCIFLPGLWRPPSQAPLQGRVEGNSGNRVGYSGCKTSTPLPKFTAVSLSSAEESLGSFSNDDGDGIEDVKKAIALLRKTTTLHVHHAFLYISLPSLHDYDVKMPNCKFFWGRKQATTNLFFSL